MKHSYFVIADEDTVLGFKAVGIPGQAVSTSPEVIENLQAARERAVGIIIVTEEVADMARVEIDSMRTDLELPMVVEIPGPQGPLSGRRNLTAVIREAIGVKI